MSLSNISSGFRIDSEFYRYEYTIKDQEISKIKTINLGHLAKVTDGEHGSVSFVSDGVKYLTAEHVKQGYIDASGARFVDHEVDRRNARARVAVGDVLVSIKGTLGSVGLAEQTLLPANMNRDVAILKPFQGSPSGEYITSFLRSRFGEYQLARESSGGVQQMITLERLRKVRVPIVEVADEKEVAKIYQNGLRRRQESINLYKQAQQLLEAELGLDKLTFEQSVGYEASFSEVVNCHRTDADYYQKKYKQLRNQIKNYPHGWDYLKTQIKIIKPNIDPGKSSGQYFNYIELSNINPSLGTIEQSTCLEASKLPSRAKRLVNSGDIIASAVVGSVDKAAIVSEEFDGSIASTGFFHFRPESISPEYFLILVRSTAVVMQLQQEATGGILSAVSDARLLNVIVPLIPKDLQDEITYLVKESHKKNIESKQLLEQAKTRVEQLIEQAVQAC